MTRRFRALYGAGPLNLVVLLVSFVIAGAAVIGWFQRPRDVETILEWFAAAILLHDLVAVPLYTLLDRIVFRWLPRMRSRGGARGKTVVGVVNSTPYLRIPAILSGLLLIVFFPVILGLGAQSELSASGIAESGYLARWLIASGVMFGVSGVAWGVAVAQGRGAVARRAPGVAADRAPTPLGASAGDAGSSDTAVGAPADDTAVAPAPADDTAAAPAAADEAATSDTGAPAPADPTAPSADDPPAPAPD